MVDMDMPMVSFVLPAYKRRFLKEAIESILGQTHRDFELIVVDDCSPEDLEEIVRTFSDGRVSYHRNAANLGGRDLVAAWTHAMSFATGEWCVLASDDDLYHPDYLREMLSLSERYPHCDLFHCRLRLVDGEGKLIRTGPERKAFESLAEFVESRGIGRALQAAPDFMFRRSAYERIGGFVKFPLAWFSDDATWYALAKEGGVACSEKVLFDFRLSGENITSRADILPRKVRATDLFLDWFCRFGEGLPPMVLNGVREATYQVVRSDFRKLKKWAWLSSFLTPMPWRLRVGVMSDRLRKVSGRVLK